MNALEIKHQILKLLRISVCSVGSFWTSDDNILNIYTQFYYIELENGSKNIFNINKNISSRTVY